MSITYDIRNLKTPLDLERKRSDFFKTLRLQAKLNRDYEDSMIARQQIDKLGLAPMLDVPLNAETERTEVMLQYDIAVKHLRTFLTEQQALNALGRFTDEEVFQLNSQWSTIEPLIMDKKNIMSGQFLVMFFRRYMDNLSREGMLGTEIPLLETTIIQLPQDVRMLWQTFAKGYVDSQTGKPWDLDTLISITASSLKRSIDDVENEVKNRMSILTRYAPARIALTSYFEKPSKKKAGERPARPTSEKMNIIGENASETFATVQQLDEANAENAGRSRFRVSDEGAYVDIGAVPGIRRPGLVGQAEQMNRDQQGKRQRTTGQFRRFISPVNDTTTDYVPADTSIIIPTPIVRPPRLEPRGTYMRRVSRLATMAGRTQRDQQQFEEALASARAARQPFVFDAATSATEMAASARRQRKPTQRREKGIDKFQFPPKKPTLSPTAEIRQPAAQQRRAQAVAQSRVERVNLQPEFTFEAAASPAETSLVVRRRPTTRSESQREQRLQSLRRGETPPTRPPPRSESDREKRLRREAQLREEGRALVATRRAERRQAAIAGARSEEEQRIADAIAARTGQLGQGVRVLHPRPGRGVKLGKGLPENARGIRYAQFGKYIIHLPSLDKHTISIKYPSVLSIADIPNKHVSQKFIDMIKQYLATDTIDKGMFNNLEEEEQEFFHYLTRRCAVDTGMSGAGAMTDRERKDMERFELIRGQVIAGNNAPEVLKELKQYLLKFLSEKRITRAVGNQILYEIAMLS